MNPQILFLLILLPVFFLGIGALFCALWNRIMHQVF